MQDGPRYLTESDLNTLTTTKQTQYGATGVTGDSRSFRYVGFGGTSTIVPGAVVVAAALKSNSAALVITAVGTGTQTAANLLAGSTQIVLTNSSTAVTQDEFAEGFLEVTQTSGTSEGPIAYKIRGNSAAAATTGYITVYLQEPLRNAETLVAGTDTASLTQSPYQGVAPSGTPAEAIGATIIQVPNSSTVTNYGWVQVSGHALLTLDSTTNGITKGGILYQSATAGQVAPAAQSLSHGTAPGVAIAKETAAASAVVPARLTM